MLAGLPPDRILAHMDDVIVFAKTFKEHLNQLRNLINRLQNSGIQLKADKCKFGKHRIEFLGFELSNKGIQPQNQLTDAVDKFAETDNS